VPPFKKQWGCKFRCCLIWFPVREGLLVIGCAHCPKIAQKIQNVAGEQDVLDRLVAGSHAGHKKICGRPIR
jgi:hypothetical protein